MAETEQPTTPAEAAGGEADTGESEVIAAPQKAGEEQKPLPRARRFYWAINGLHTEAENPYNWNAHFKRYVHRETPDVADAYQPEASAWNRWRKRARHIKELAYVVRDSVMSEDALVLVGHSYGAQLILDMLHKHEMLLCKEIHLIASSAHCDCDANHLNEILGRNQVESAYFYCSKSDRVLGRLADKDDRLTWIVKKLLGKDVGFGQFGLLGPCNLHSAMDPPRTKTIWCDGYGHSTYFDEDHRRDTFHRLTNGGEPPLVG